MLMFGLLTDESGKVSSVIQGSSVYPASDIEKLRQAAAWAGKLTPPEDLDGQFPPGALVFLDRKGLVETCGLSGTMLHATGGRFTEGMRHTFGGRPWVSLNRAVAVRPEDEGPQNPTGITSELALIWAPQPLFESLSSVFTAGNDNDSLWCISSIPVKRAFVYLDVSGFSKYPPGQEALIINTLVSLVADGKAWQHADAAGVRLDIEAQLCIGDGYIYVFRDPLKATLFASWLAELIQQLVARREQMGVRRLPVAFHFRVGVHYGPVYRFYDPGRGRWNYIGDGINGGNRVLSVIDKKYDDILFVSDAVVNEFIARRPTGIYANVRNCLENRGRQEDKHGKPWRVYLLNHTKLCEDPMRTSLG
jgi:class 3 adenylate cyclase